MLGSLRIVEGNGLVGKRFVFGAAVAATSVASASTPSPALIGVERVVIACEPDASISHDERRTLCEQLVRKAQTVTSLPVTVATARDLVSDDLARQSKQLVLRVRISGVPVEQGRKALSLTVIPVRMARPQGELGPLESSTSLVKVQDRWVVQGPVDAFNKVLGGFPPPLRRPVRSDS